MKLGTIAVAVILGSLACARGDSQPDGFATGIGTGGDQTSAADDSRTDTAPATGESSGTDSGTADGVADDDTGSTGAPPPPYACDVEPTASPVLAGQVLFDPETPHPGDAVTVIVRATNGLGRPDAPPMMLEVDSANGLGTYASQTIEGGEAIYYYTVADVPQGDLCFRGLIDDAPEVSAKLTVTPRPAGPPIDGGIYKITSNHMWTCDEQPNNGNELHVWVRDEDGVGIDGAAVELSLADSTDLGSIYNGDARALPRQIVTGSDGHAMAFNYWPISDHGLLVFKVSMAGFASDVATEITTGWWEDDLMGCSYCGTPTINVWGHWSYTVEFQRDLAATEACIVANDHAGMTTCGEPRHVHHDPAYDTCWTP